MTIHSRKWTISCALIALAFALPLSGCGGPCRLDQAAPRASEDSGGEVSGPADDEDEACEEELENGDRPVICTSPDCRKPD
jgi:hypothetical protein